MFLWEVKMSKLTKEIAVSFAIAANRAFIEDADDELGWDDQVWSELYDSWFSVSGKFLKK